MIIGIDPGLKGGICAMDKDGRIHALEVMPTKKVGKPKMTAPINLYELICTFKAMGGHFFIERIMAYGMNPTSCLTMGRNYGYLEACLELNRCKVTYVEPSKWCKEIHAGIDKRLKPKERSLIAVERLFPEQPFLATERCKKPHDGLIDGALIAEYGRRILYATNTVVAGSDNSDLIRPSGPVDDASARPGSLGI